MYIKRRIQEIERGASQKENESTKYFVQIEYLKMKLSN